MKKISTIALFIMMISGFGFFGVLNREVIAKTPAAPVMSVTNISGDTVGLNIQQNSTADGYILYYKTPEGLSKKPCELDLGNKTSVELQLWEGAGFYFTVRAYNSFGKSDFSNIEYVFVGGDCYQYDCHNYDGGEILLNSQEHWFFQQFSNPNDSPTNVNGSFKINVQSQVIKHVNIETITEYIWNDDGTYTTITTEVDNSTYSQKNLFTDFSDFKIYDIQTPNTDITFSKNYGAIDFTEHGSMLNIVTHNVISHGDSTWTLGDKISQIDGENGWNGVGPGSATYFEFDSSGDISKVIKNFIYVNSEGILSYGHLNTRTSSFQYLRSADYDDRDETPKGTPLHIYSLPNALEYLGVGFSTENIFWDNDRLPPVSCPIILK